MDDRPAVNASPLIFLARSSLVDLLQVAGPQIVVPSPVAEEIDRRGSGDPTAAALARTSWLVVVDPPPPPVIQAWDLGAGESAVITWAHTHPGTQAILDDLAGRRCAAALGIPVRGTLGPVLAAKQRGLIREARPVLDELRRGGMYLSDRILDRALAEVGE